MLLDDEDYELLGYKEPWSKISDLAFSTKATYRYFNGPVHTDAKYGSEACRGCGKEEFERRPKGQFRHFCTEQCYKAFDKKQKQEARDKYVARPTHCASCNVQLPSPVIKSNNRLSKPRKFCNANCKVYLNTKNRRAAAKLARAS